MKKRIISIVLAVALLLSMPITAVAEAVLAIDVTTLPTKVIYYEGEALDVTGGELTVYYASSEETVALTQDMVTGFDSSMAGTRTLTVTYQEATCFFDVQILPRAAFAIAVTTLPDKLTYLEAKEVLDVTGGELTIRYGDGTADKAIPLTLDMVTGFDNTIVGIQTLTVTYAGQTTTFDVEILAKALTSIAVSQVPAKVRYLLGEERLDVTEGKIRADYDNGTSEILDMTAEMVSGFDGTVVGKQTITVTLGGKTASYQVEVFETEVLSISVAAMPAVTRFLLNVDDLDVTGGEVRVNCYDGTWSVIPMTEDMITGYDNTVPGTQTLTVTYAEKTAAFSVELCENNTTEFLSGIGSSARPYMIKTKEHLDHVRNYLDAHFMMITDIVFTEEDFLETGDYYNGGEFWKPIGNFKGFFDGNGHTISGLKINITSSSTRNIGLFGNMTAGEIKNLGMLNSLIQADVYSSNTDFYIGGIVGRASNSSITNCCNAGTISILADCASTASRTVAAYAGGIAGNAGSSTTITGCYNTGSVSAMDPTDIVNGYAYGGGISGNGGVITDCYNTGTIFGGEYAGGIAGGGYRISGCYNTGTVTGNSRYRDAFAGGIAGVGGSMTDSCYNTGAVTATSRYISGDSYAGGILGRASSSTVIQCFNLGDVMATANSSNLGAGGIVGYAYGTSTVITNSYNAGSISAPHISDKGVVGGILGYDYSGVTITNSYYRNTAKRGVGLGGSNSATTACTLEEMKQQETFVGLDFDTVWIMVGDENYLLPRLQSVPMVETHRYSGFVSNQDATCAADGTKTSSCDYCDKSETVVDEGSALDHDLVQHEAKAPTCTEPGWDAYVTCTQCDYTTYAEKAALGHDYADGACTRCGEADPDCAPPQSEGIVRIYGKSRVDTSLAIADQVKEVLGIQKFDAIVVANAMNFPDALTGSYLAVREKAPILLVSNSAWINTATYITENLSETGTVYILGGTGAVTADLESFLTQTLDISCKRLSGKSRYDTNLVILNEAGITNQEILISTGLNFADSLSASAANLPVLMVNGKGTLTDSQKEFLETYKGNKMTIIGGSGAVSEAIKAEIEAIVGHEIGRLSGKSRQDTSVLVAKTYISNPSRIVLASSMNFPDGLCGGPLAYFLGAPLILTTLNQEAAAAGYVAEHGITAGFVLGGTGAVKDQTVDAVFGN